jgi:acetyl-CoA carboxylase biotin carboxyl carrier protein
MKPLRPAPHSAKRAEESSESNRELRQVRELAKILNQNELAEIEFENAGMRVRLRREAPATPVAAPATVIATPLTAPPPAAAASAAKASAMPAAAPVPAEADGTLITSPFVGTFYRSPSPDVGSFVDKGQRIKKGQVLCIVEAMKLMNEIESDLDGVILDILVENGQPVEYGEPLFRIGP